MSLMNGLKEKWRSRKTFRRRSIFGTSHNLGSETGVSFRHGHSSGNGLTTIPANTIPSYERPVHPLSLPPSPIDPSAPAAFPPIDPSILEATLQSQSQAGGPYLVDPHKSTLQTHPTISIDAAIQTDSQPRGPPPSSEESLPQIDPIIRMRQSTTDKSARRRSSVWVAQTIDKVVHSLSPFSPPKSPKTPKSSKGTLKLFHLRRNTQHQEDEPIADLQDNKTSASKEIKDKNSQSAQDNTTPATANTSQDTSDDISDVDDLDIDLRSFYDYRSEDPSQRIVFIAGPEHFYYLALQLETSPREEFQLYAKELFIRSAGLGYAPAQFKLGICYELGLSHFPMDPSHSFLWYKRAALQGHADAELAVSGWYLTGHPQGLIQSEPLAYEWASKAARRGWSKAEYTLGHYHEVGIGVPQDLQLAKQWYLKAAARGNERALLRLLVGHVGLEVDYAHLKDALLAQNENNPYLVHQLAQFHELREYGLVPDEDAAFELYAASAQANYAPAQYKLGACYEFGILGCTPDPVQAVQWYGQGADNGHVEALLALAGFYLDGSAGTAAPHSDQEAFRLVKEAARRGVPKAEYITGYFLEYGLGVPQNPREAKQWYHLACAKGVDSADGKLRNLERAIVTATT